MKNSSIPRAVIGSAAGLAAILSGVGNGCGMKPIEGDVPGLPAEDIYFNRTMDVFESDAKKPEGVAIPLATDSQYGGTVNFDRVTILDESNGRNAPYYVQLVTTDDISGNRQSMIIRDNNETFVSGEAWSIRVYGRGTSNEGRKVNYTETFTTFYKKGRSNEELGDEIDGINDDLENGPIEGDGVCQRGLGESEDSIDCVQQNNNGNGNQNDNITNDNFNGNMNDNSNDNGNENNNLNENGNVNINDNNGGNTNDNFGGEEESFVEKLSRNACSRFEREMESEGLPLRLYRVTSDTEGSILNSEELDRIGDHYFKIGTRNNGTYVIGVAGNAFQPVTAMYEAEGKLPIFYFNESDCNHVGILNPNGEDFSVSRNEIDHEGVLGGRIQAYGSIVDIVEN